MSDKLKLFEAVFNPDTKKIEITLGTKHLPFLTFGQKLLDLEITSIILEEPMQSSAIISPKLGIKL